MSYNYMLFEKFFRRGAGVAERAALEMPYARERIEGSNPSLSAICNRTLVRVYKLLREIERTLWFAYSANAVHYTTRSVHPSLSAGGHLLNFNCSI